MTAASWALEQERRHLASKVLYFTTAFNSSVARLPGCHGPLVAYVRDVEIPERAERLEQYEAALDSVEAEIELAGGLH